MFRRIRTFKACMPDQKPGKHIHKPPQKEPTRPDSHKLKVLPDLDIDSPPGKEYERMKDPTKPLVSRGNRRSLVSDVEPRLMRKNLHAQPVRLDDAKHHPQNKQARESQPSFQF